MAYKWSIKRETKVLQMVRELDGDDKHTEAEQATIKLHDYSWSRCCNESSSNAVQVLILVPEKIHEFSTRLWLLFLF